MLGLVLAAGLILDYPVTPSCLLVATTPEGDKLVREAIARDCKEGTIHLRLNGDGFVDRATCKETISSADVGFLFCTAKDGKAVPVPP